MDKFWNKTLTRKMIKLLLLGFCIAVAFFLVFSYIGNVLLNEYFIGSDFIYNAATAYIDDLSSFIQEENISATDTSRLNEWVHKKRINHFTVSRDRILIYDNSYPDSVILGQAEVESLHYIWPYFHSVSFADGDADVYIDANYETKYYLLFYLFSLILSMLVWISFFSLGIRKEVMYIRQLCHCVTQIGAGELNSEVFIKGVDELGVLARGLDQMRLSLIEKEENEKKLKLSQDKLVLSMAHDLRTPLTGLMTFLEIAKKQHSLQECNNYINKAYTKTIQIRNLSNQLFDFFLISSEHSVKLEDPANVEYSLGEYLSELCCLLQIDHYPFTIDNLCWKPVQVRICVDYMGRIINNIVSNIKKYADPNAPIILSTAYSSRSASIIIQNKIAHPNQYIHGTGIGIKNVHAMMCQMNGTCNTCIEADTYSITLTFPITMSQDNVSSQITSRK